MTTQIYSKGDVIHVTVPCLNGLEKVHGHITNYDADEGGYDVKLEKHLAFEGDSVPYPLWMEPDTCFKGPTSVKLNKIFVEVDDETLTLMHPEKVKTLYAPLHKRLQHVFGQLTFRRVYTVDVVERFGDARIFSYEKDVGVNVKKATHKDLEEIEAKYFSTEKNNQKNEELKYRKKCMQEKGKYHGFTNKRALRKDDNWNDKSIYFNPKGYFELDALNKGTWEWFRPHNDQVYQIPYQGDLICGIVKNGDKGPYFEKWFLCSEQFMKLVTLLLHPDHESIEKARNALARRLKSNKFSEWIKSDEGKNATQDEIDNRFHRTRYEQGSHHPFLYMWIGFLVCKGDDDIEELEDAQQTLLQMASYFK